MKLVLKCCCCGTTMATLDVPWSPVIVRPEIWWTREPCDPCEVKLAAERVGNGRS